jgi:integrase/recombinase XerD
MPWSVQRVIQPDGEESWTVTDPAYDVVDPVDRFLAHLGAVDRSPGTVRSYAFDLRDFFTFLEQSQVRWRDVQLENLGRFANWLRLAPAERSGQLRRLTDRAEHCSATTINRKLSAVGSFYQFHQQHGAGLDFLPLSRRRGSGGSWKPLLAHLGGSARPGKELKRRKPARIPRTLSQGQVSAVLDACDHLRDRLLFALLAGSGMRNGEALGLRHEDIDAAEYSLPVLAGPRMQRTEPRLGPFLGWVKEIAAVVLIAVVLSFLIKTFLFRAFFIPSPSIGQHP